MIPAPVSAHDDTCYLALKARDRRFDGIFFTGVTSTGIYCRPVCRVRTPKRENCRFFPGAAQAEQAGFRPCLRCRPELAPGQPTFGSRSLTQAWSMQDASGILAQHAARLMDGLAPGHADAASVARLAQRLGISDRHLRRIFGAEFGVPPLRYLQTRQLLCAKQLLTDTSLSVSRVAQISGFASVRRFNAVFLRHYRLNPTQLRQTADRIVASGSLPASIELHLAYRPPYDVDAMLQFFARRAVTGIELVTLTPACKSIATTLRIGQGQSERSGWLIARFDEARWRVTLTVSDSLGDVLPAVMAAVRVLLDLDADPQAINAVLHERFPAGDGLRLPGALDGFSLAVRTVLGQQVTVAAARTLCNRLAQRFGQAMETPVAGLNRLFPDAQVLGDANCDALGQLGIVRQRQKAILALAQAVCRHALQLQPGADVSQTLVDLQALPGIGDWTAQYIAMRALAWPDAFPAGDVALQKALGVQDQPDAARAARLASVAWRPWRSYAVIRAWASLPETGQSTQLTS